jgi:hypothetical protein
MELQGHQTFPARKRKVRRWIVIYAGCTVAALLFASTMYVLMDVLKNVPPKPHLLFVWWATRFYLWAALSPAVVRILRRLPLHPISVSSGFLHFAASLLFSLFHFILHLSLALILIGSPNLPGGSSSLLQQAVHSYPLGVLAYWFIIAVESTTNYYERYGREQLRSSQLQAQLAEAHLRTLQMQLQPHLKRACDLPRVPDGQYTRVAGCVIARQRPGTAKGFVFLSLEDETGISNVIVNPDLYEKYRVVINREKFLRVEGVLQN